MRRRDAAQRPLGGIVGHAQAAIVEEADQCVPGVEAVGDRLGDLAVRREPGVLLAQPGAQRLDARATALVADLAPLVGRQSVDVALDGEQRIDAGHRLDGDRRLGEPRQVEELAPRMGPARRLDDRTGPRPVLDVLLAVYRASAGKTHHRYYISVDRLALPLNRERAKAAILLGVLSGWLAGGGSPVHSVALTDEGLGVLRARRIID